MNFTTGEVLDIGAALGQIMNNPRNIPQTGKYRIARLFDKMRKHAEKAELKRYELIKELGDEKIDEKTQRSLGWQVKPENMEQYKTRLEAIRAEDAGNIDVEPIKLAALGDAPDGIEAHEFQLLGRLVVE